MPRIVKKAGPQMHGACVEAYARAYKAYLAAYSAAVAQGGEPPSLPAYILDGDLWAEALDTAPPKVTFLTPLLMTLPPVVARASIGREILPGIISASTLRRDEAAGKGPRAAFIGESKLGVTYPAPMLLEYLETKLTPTVEINAGPS